MSTLPLTPSQTVGPFFARALLRVDTERHILTTPETRGERIRIEGRVLDGDGAPVPDALVEIWQANADGRYNHPADTRPARLDPSFLGFGRSGSQDDVYWFETIKPGPVPFAGRQTQSPHIVVTVFARGLLNHVVTRLYFADEPANASDPILRRVPAERRSTLLARRVASGESGAAGELADSMPVYRFDIVLQGAGETVFFQV
ncbi:MAG TPA: protocatechuate 3,4-dioxygenase subunit alpha [Ktedonobacterales bacterium]|nr:protocatechuate 3,4-dioxygenase subunit alpha [Ktedonobacterales bacterium]